MNQKSASERDAIWDAFLKIWPKSRVEKMTLEEYSRIGDKDSFTYWLEAGTQDLGSIWGGSAFKFGIYHMNPARPDKEYASGSMHKSDGEYAWYARMGSNRDEVYRIIKERILLVIEAVQSGRLEEISPVELGRALRWKIASLYQDRKDPLVLPIFNKPAFKFIMGVKDNRVSMAQLQRMAKRDRGATAFWEYYDTAWKKWADHKFSLLEAEASDEDEDEEIDSPQTEAVKSTQRFWAFSCGKGGNRWQEFQREGIIAIGWDYLGDLKAYPNKEAIGQTIREYDNDPENSKKNSLNACWSFCNEMKPGDVVYAKIGMNKILGKGIVRSEYRFDDSRADFQNVRRVEWVASGPWEVNETKRFPLKTLTDLTQAPDLILYIEELIHGASKAQETAEYAAHFPEAASPIETAPAYDLETLCTETGYGKTEAEGWLGALARKKQAVFFGPPGTGKTYLVERLARHLVSGTDGLVDCIQFHPSYTYEEFIQGIRPEPDATGNLRFAMKPGRFLEFCEKARARSGPSVLIIDEINRANLSRVFGELMYLLEYREKEIILAGGIRFSIPEKVRILATMNTADRSIALVDFALRRRFAFLELKPEYRILREFHQARQYDADPLIRILESLNAKIGDRNFHLGISFFMSGDMRTGLERVWKAEIEPYLEEYFFGQPNSVSEFRWDKIEARLPR